MPNADETRRLALDLQAEIADAHAFLDSMGVPPASEIAIDQKYDLAKRLVWQAVADGEDVEQTTSTLLRFQDALREIGTECRKDGCGKYWHHPTNKWCVECIAAAALEGDTSEKELPEGYDRTPGTCICECHYENSGCCQLCLPALEGEDR